MTTTTTTRLRLRLLLRRVRRRVLLHWRRVPNIKRCLHPHYAQKNTRHLKTMGPSRPSAITGLRSKSALFSGPGLADAMLWHREKRVPEDVHRAADFAVHGFRSVPSLQKVLELCFGLLLVVLELPAEEDLTGQEITMRPWPRALSFGPSPYICRCHRRWRR